MRRGAAIAKWDGTACSVFGSWPTSGGVSALAVSGADLYAAVGAANYYLAKWDGSTWSALGAEPDGLVYALAVSGTDLYVGGSFAAVGSLEAYSIAKWDGSAWSALGLGMNGTVYALAVSGTNLYAGGLFSWAGAWVGEVPANNIARWDGNTWSALGSGINGTVYALAVIGTNLYAGGSFTNAGGVTANGIAQWDGSAWSALGSVGGHLSGGQNPYVAALAADGAGHLFVGGAFSLAGTNVSPCIAEADVGKPGSPFIVASPASLAVPVGATADFQVAASGSPPLIYEWVFNGTTAIAGATSSVLSLTNVQLPQAGAYTVVVTNAYGAATSAPAWLQVFPSGIVATNSELELRAAMALGGTVTFSCDGTITLTQTITNTSDTRLDGSGHQIIISGSNACRVFFVNSNVNLTLVNLTIANGLSTNGYGGGIYNEGTVNATNTTFDGNEVLGASSLGWPGTTGGSALGGAVANSGVMNLINCSFTNNSAVGGAGGHDPDPGYGQGCPGGTGSGGAVWNSGLLTGNGWYFCGQLRCRWDWWRRWDWVHNGTQLKADPGGPGGDGSGSALFNCGVARLVNCTLALNTGAGGAGGMGGAGSPGFPYYSPPGPNGSSGLGIDAIYDASGQCDLTNCTVAFNPCGGIWTSGAATVNTLLVENVPGGNCLGTITDLGHNLSSDTTCAFTNVGSLNNTYALIGPLTNNGGPTPTIALLPGSRAIDAGDTAAAPPTDQRGVPRPFGTAADIGAYEYNAPTNPGPSSVVTECTEASLRAAMSGGGTVTFTCDGTITLATPMTITTNTVLDAAGHQIMIRGAFNVSAGIAFSLANLTTGGGLLNAGGVLTATNCVFSGSYATRGGAIRNDSGVAYFSACVFTGNSAFGTPGAGGALDNSGTLTADLCTFIANSAVGEGGLSSGGDGEGGAICNFGTMTILRSTFTNNYAEGDEGANGLAGYFGDDPGMSGGDGGAEGSGGAGNGGAIYNAGTLRLINSTFVANLGAGANGGAGGAGGDSIGGPSTSGGSGGGGGAGGTGVGAVFNLGSVQLVNCTFALNSGSGGNGGAGGAGGSGAVIGGNGGSGGSGGSGFGAISGLSSFCGLTNCTFGSDQGTRGAGAAGGSAGTGSYRNGNPGASGGEGISGGISAGGAGAVNTLLADTGGNCSGSVTDLGHNLSSDSSCGFANIGSMNNTDPKLGPLANNGGPTLTMALLPGSPAIDAGDTSLAPATDQRGFPRPAGLAADIGAFEYGSVMPTVAISLSGANVLNILGSGNANQPCRLLSSTDLLNWVPTATNQFGSDGTILFEEVSAPGGACRFYRLVMP